MNRHEIKDNGAEETAWWVKARAAKPGNQS